MEGAGGRHRVGGRKGRGDERAGADAAAGRDEDRGWAEAMAGLVRIQSRVLQLHYLDFLTDRCSQRPVFLAFVVVAGAAGAAGLVYLSALRSCPCPFLSLPVQNSNQTFPAVPLSNKSW